MASLLSNYDEDLFQVHSVHRLSCAPLTLIDRSRSLRRCPRHPLARAGSVRSPFLAALRHPVSLGSGAHRHFNAEPSTPEAFEAAKMEPERHLARWKAENAKERVVVENERASRVKIRKQGRCYHLSWIDGPQPARTLRAKSRRGCRYRRGGGSVRLMRAT